jgi:energy-coupling factor transporter ATP-binding protein EcfA2
MVEAHFDDLDRSYTSNGPSVRFFDTPFLREILNDLTLALDLGRPAFLLGPPGSGKSTLVGQAALRLAERYGVARIMGRRGLGLDDVVEACRAGFAPEAWADLSVSRARDPREPIRPGDNVVIVDEADAIQPRFVEQMVAISNGSPDLLPSHRILFAGSEDLADVIESGRVRNNWGTPLVLQLKPWPREAVAPFLRRRLRSAGLGDPDLLSDAAIQTIADEAGGNPGRMLDLARRVLQPDEAQAPDWIELPTEPVLLSAGPATTTIIDLEPVAITTEGPATILFAEPPTAPMVDLNPSLDPNAASGAAVRRLRIEPKRLVQMALPVGLVVAAGFIVWALDDPAPPPPILPPQAEVAAAAPAPVPPPVVAPAPAAAPAPVVAVVPPVSASPPETAPVSSPPDDEAPAIAIGTLLARGDDLLNGGDFAAARLFYLQAARAGNAAAAAGVARTYDPQVLDRLGVVGARGEPAKAAEWYRKAVDLGDPSAAEPLRRLAPS